MVLDSGALYVPVSPGDSGSVVPVSVEGDSVLGEEEEGAVDVGGQGAGVPEAHVDDGDEGAVGVDTLTDGEGLTGGLVRWSWWPVSPRCREIHSPWPGS